MKVQTRHKPTASKLWLLRQLCNLIPNHLVPQLAWVTGNEAQARTFSPWSHVVSLLYAQVTHGLGLNDVCDAIQEHRMIVKAVNHGVPPERVAAALNLPVRIVRAFVNLLRDIHPEVAVLLKDKNIAPRTIRLLRRVNGVRQIEIVELLVDSNNYTNGHVEALILGTPPDQLAKPVPAKQRKGFSPEHLAQMESEMATLERDFKAVESNYGQNVLHLTLARAYIRKLLNNVSVAGFFKNSHADVHAEFEKITTAETL